MGKQKAVRSWAKRSLVIVLGLTLVFGSVGQPVQAEERTGKVQFKRQVGGIFDGMPLFDGNPDHLDDFIEAYFEYTGLEGPAVYATGTRNHYTLQRGKNAGKKIPGALSAADNVQGVSTDFPALIGLGQTWNKELLSDVGKVIGAEKISTLKVKQGDSNLHPVGFGADPAQYSQTVAFTVVSDLRINPLSGRIDEGFSEDPYMAAVMIDKMAAGLGGTDLEESEDGFWMRAAVGTKHFSVYNAQWFRSTGSYYAGPRAIYEYHTRSPLKALSTGSLSGVMTSFGRTNGIPNIISPYQRHANQYAKYGMYSSPDFNADQAVFTSLGNGYDKTYAIDRTHATILMILAQANAGRPMPSEENGVADVLAVVDAVEQGLYGITAEDLIEAAKPHVIQMVRVGIFNEVDENGIPKYYPFAKDAADVSEVKKDYSVPEHQEVAMRAAEESIVLLKNDGVLPLNKNQKVAISGVYADARFKTTYSTNHTPLIENSGLSPLSAIIRKIGSENVVYDTGNRIVGFISKLNGEVVSADLTGDVLEGGQLITVDAEFDEKQEAFLFERYDWGQEGSSLRSLVNGRWVTLEDMNVSNTNDTLLNLTDNDWVLLAMQGDTSTIPPRFRIENNDDGTVSLIANGYQTGFGGGFETWYYTNGRFVTTTADSKLQAAEEPIGDAENAAIREDHVKFEQIVVQDVAENAVKHALEADYAIVFVGAIPRHSAGEGNDRSSLDMSETDYELVEKVSAAFAEQGKKTIVVVRASFPVGMERIQNNPNVSAILYQPYGGQYDGYALAEVLFGDATPTGRLSTTWYKDISVLPQISKYSLPEDRTDLTLEDIDPRFTVDYTNADPIETKLTYMYTEAPVTYEFGYGLSYSEFAYRHLKAPNSVASDQPFTVTVDIENIGDVDTAEVVQLYMKHQAPAYGNYAPKKKLVSFEKVWIPAGETRTVQLVVDPQDLAVWDVNLGDFVVEDGHYLLMVGASSEDIRLEQTIEVKGRDVASLIAGSFSVFDHSFASGQVVYYEVSKARTAAQLKAKKVVGGYYAVGSKQAGSWVAIPKVNLTDITSVTASVASDQQGGTITLHAGSPESEAIATIHVPVTERVTYTIDQTEVSVTELGYTEVDAPLVKRLNGVYDLYVVFHQSDLRIDRLQLKTDVERSVTRAEFVSNLVRALGLVASDGMQFADVDADDAQARLIAAAYEAGITLGRSADLFAPEAEITREEMVVMLMRAHEAVFGPLTKRTEPLNFMDQDQISSWALEAVNAGIAHGWIDADQAEFLPKESVSYAESLEMINRLFD